jgi:hypothetical protein
MQQSSASSSSAPAPSDPLAALAQLQQQHAALQQQVQQQAMQQQQQFAHMQQAAMAQAAAVAAGAPAAAAPRSLPKIAPVIKFKGTMGGAADTWNSAMVQQFVYYGITDEATKLRMAAGNLEGDALTWYNSIPHVSAPTTWNEFMEQLYRRFRPVAAVLIARQSLAKLRMGPGHSVSAYTHRFQTILTAINDMSAADQVFQYTYGLTPALASHVWEKHPATLAEAIEVAASKEATQGLTAGRGAGPSHFRSGAGASSGSVPMDINHIAHGGAEDEESEAAPRFHEEPSAARMESLLLAKFEAMEQRLAALSSKPAPSNSSNKSGDRVPGLKPGDIERLMKEGRCFRCKQTGHRKADCHGPIASSKSGN